MENKRSQADFWRSVFFVLSLVVLLATGIIVFVYDL